MNLLNAFLELLYPPKCIICDEPILDYGYCRDCLGKLKPIAEPLCLQCGLDNENCECRKNIYHFDAIVAPYFNEGYGRQAVYDLKFKHKFNCLIPFSEDISKCIKKNIGVENIDLICCVPAKKSSLYHRGFNQAELFAREIANCLKIDFSANLISIVDEGKTQHRLKTVQDRFENVRNKYKASGNVKGKNILVIDDIKTTGATIDECARQLKFVGANKVYCATALVTKRSHDVIDV